jgi:hypothetical protein
MSMERRLILWCVLAILVATQPVLAVEAQQSQPGLQMEARAAFDGHFKYGQWLPVWVELENDGSSVDAEVRVRVVGSWGRTTFAAPVSLPTGSRKRVPVYVLPNNYSRALKVDLVQGEKVLASQDIEVRSHINTDFLVGLLAPQRGAMSLISGASWAGTARDVVLFDLALADIPERAEGLSSLDCLVFNDVDTSTLSPDQQAALASWVRQGGRLVVGGGTGALHTVAGLPRPLLPLAPQGQLDLNDVSALAGFAGNEPVRVPGPFVVAVGDVLEGQTLVAQGDVALVRERRVGIGYADLVALDLSASPFDAWAGTAAFWSRLILSSATYPQGMPSDMSVRQMRSGQLSYALSNLPSLALPSVQGLALLLGVYIVLVGPVNYVVLRWRKRLHWAWITIPLITVLFSGGAFGLGYAMRGTDLIVNKIAIVALQPDGAAHVDTYMGLFSPSQQSYEVEIDRDALLSPLNPDSQPFSSMGTSAVGEAVFIQGQPARVRGLTVNQWSMQTFMSEDTWPDVGRVVADFYVEDQSVAGTVRNETDLDLRDVVVVLGNEFTRLGDLEAGQQVDVRLRVENGATKGLGPPLSYRLFEDEFRQSGPSGPPRSAQLKQSVLEGVFSAGREFSSFSGWGGNLSKAGGYSSVGLFLLGWFDEAPPYVRVGNREPAEQTTALLYAPLAYRFRESGPIAVPPGLIPGLLTQMPREGGLCGEAGVAAVYIGRGDALFEFRLPEELQDVEVEELVLAIGSDGGWTEPPETALYSWEAEGWVTLEDPIVGRNIIHDPAALVSHGGLVRVRLSSTGRQGGCLFLDLGLEGTL